MSQHDVFISFANEDRSLADSTRSSLESDGLLCWMAPRDIPDGVPYAAAIVDGIRTAKALIVLLTPNSRSSPHVLREVECAISANCSIATLQLFDTEPDKALAYYLGPTQWIPTTPLQISDALRTSSWLARLRTPQSLTGEATGHFVRPKVYVSPLTSACLSSGAALLVATLLVMFMFGPLSQRWQENIFAAQNRLVLSVSLAIWLMFGVTAEGLVEKHREPYHPLRGRNIPSYLIVALLLWGIGMLLWCMTNPMAVSHLLSSYDGSEHFELPPDFAFQWIDTYSVLGVLDQAMSSPPAVANMGFQSLLSLCATSLVLGGVALLIYRATPRQRHQPLVADVIVALPFVLVRATWGFSWLDKEDPYRVPIWIYWTIGILACLLSGVTTKIMLKRIQDAA